MDGTGGTAAIAEEDKFAAGEEVDGGFFGELRDAGDQVIGEGLLDAGAFVELAADFVGGPGRGLSVSTKVSQSTRLNSSRGGPQIRSDSLGLRLAPWRMWRICTSFDSSRTR